MKVSRYYRHLLGAVLLTVVGWLIMAIGWAVKLPWVFNELFAFGGIPVFLAGPIWFLRTAMYMKK